MWRGVLLGLLLACCVGLGGCVTPSTLLVNDDGDVKRCSAYGYGAMGVATAGGIHSGCVADMKKLGYMPLSDVTTGIHAPKGSTVIDRFTPGSQAPAAGLRVGDTVRTINGAPPVPATGLMRALAGKQVGDTVPVIFERDGQVRTADVPLIPRGE